MAIAKATPMIRRQPDAFAEISMVLYKREARCDAESWSNARLEGQHNLSCLHGLQVMEMHF